MAAIEKAKLKSAIELFYINSQSENKKMKLIIILKTTSTMVGPFTLKNASQKWIWMSSLKCLINWKKKFDKLMKMD